MPRRKSNKAKYPKSRRFKRKRPAPNKWISLGPRNMTGPFGRFDDVNPFPPRLGVRLRISEVLTLTTTNLANTASTTYDYKINSLYDSYAGVGGHQPNGFDQLMSASGPYGRYKVYGAKVTSTFYDPSADVGLWCVMQIKDPINGSSSMSGKTLAVIKEWPNTCCRYISSTGDQRVTVSQYFDMAKIASLSKLQFRADNTNFTGAYNSDPASLITLELGLLDTRSLAATTCQVETSIEFYCILYDRYTLPQS